MASKGRELGNIVSPQTGIAVTFSGDPVVLGVGNTEHVRITGAGDIYLGGYLESSTAHNTLQKIKVAPYNWTGGSTAEIASIEMGAQNTGSDDGSIIFKTATNVNTGGTLDEAMRIRYDGNIGIGTDNPSAGLDVVADASSGYIAEFRQAHASNTAQIIIDSPVDGASRPSYMDYATGGSVKWRTGLGYLDADRSFHIGTGSLPSTSKLTIKTDGNTGVGTDNPLSKLHVAGGNIKVDSGYGIDFSATSDGTGANQSELLDDYEEGTWTPKFVNITNGNDYFVNNGLTIYHANYVKIGEHCWASAYIANDASFSYATGIDGTQNIGIGGLPFTVIGSNGGFYPIYVGFYQNLNGWTAGYTPMGYFYSAYDRIVLTYATANSITNIPGTSFYNGSSSILFSGYYKVA